MNTSTDELTLENFTERTGFRFRISREQQAKIEGGSLTREQAFSEFLTGGGLERLQQRSKPEVPDSVYLEDGLTIENFSERVKAATGTARRFRVSREQAQRIENGSLTREQALVEIIALKKA